MTAVSEEYILSEELYDCGQQYISGALEICSNEALQKIWEDQGAASEQTCQISLWVVPAGSKTEQMSADVQDGIRSNVLTQKEQLADFVTAVEQSVASCCIDGINVQVALSMLAESTLLQVEFCCWRTLYGLYSSPWCHAVWMASVVRSNAFAGRCCTGSAAMYGVMLYQWHQCSGRILFCW